MPIDHRRLVTAGKRLARAAGGLYLLIMVLGGIAHLGVRVGIRVSGSARLRPPRTSSPARPWRR